MSPKKLVSTFEAPDDNVFTLYDNWETAIARYPHVREQRGRGRASCAALTTPVARARAVVAAPPPSGALLHAAHSPPPPPTHTPTTNKHTPQKVPSLGWRKRDAKGNLGPYTWLTYSQAGDIRTSIGSGLLQLGVLPKANVGLYSVNCKGRVD